MTRDQFDPGPATGVQIQKGGEEWTLILVRDLRHRPETVWEALTDPEQLHQWAPFDASSSLGVVGAQATLTTVGAAGPNQSLTQVTEAVPGRRLVYQWGGSELRWDLDPTTYGTRLTLWTQINHRYIAMGAAGWHLCLAVLNQLLANDPVGRIVAADALHFAGWQRLHLEYAEQFGKENES